VNSGIGNENVETDFTVSSKWTVYINTSVQVFKIYLKKKMYNVYVWSFSGRKHQLSLRSNPNIFTRKKQQNYHKIVKDTAFAQWHPLYSCLIEHINFKQCSHEHVLCFLLFCTIFLMKMWFWHLYVQNRTFWTLETTDRFADTS
jgi:dipeptide/tripeptide permease